MQQLNLSTQMHVSSSCGTRNLVSPLLCALQRPRGTCSERKALELTAKALLAPKRRQLCAKLLVAAVADRLDASSTFSSLLEDEAESEESEQEEVVVDESLRLENLGLCQPTVNALAARGIKALFPIQKLVFQPAMEGRDLIGRAKTGSGKTLAFALPVIENLMAEGHGKLPRMGRPPRCLVLAPTRELANQVAREFESACPSLKVRSFYGGVSIGSQMRELERGVDVVVGTPGRVIDLIERKKLDLSKIRFAILDEADQMLDMGFQEDMETILGYVPEERQTMLFSATLPSWVDKVARRFQKKPVLLDLVGEENTGKLADTIKLLTIQVDNVEKPRVLVDLLSVYGAGGKSIVFTKTKLGADEVASSVSRTMQCEALHGDIAQSQRESTLAKFRQGMFNVMVATDVAARGLDIPNVDLVVHYDVPQDPEAFLHRSGRTGRAGKAGTALLMFSGSESRNVGIILKAAKVSNGETVGSPDPRDVMTAASKSVLNKLDKVEGGVIDFFEPAAERLLASGHPTKVLAAALAAMSGFQNVPKPRSLLTSERGNVTLRVMSKPGRVDSYNSLCKEMAKVLEKANVRSAPGNFGSVVGKIRIIEDTEANKDGVAFDVPAEVGEELLSKCTAVAASMGLSLDRPKSLPLDLNEFSLGRNGRGPMRYGGGSRGGMGSRFTGRADSDRRGGGGDRRGSRFSLERRGGGGGGSGGSGGGRDDYGSRGRVGGGGRAREESGWGSSSGRRDSGPRVGGWQRDDSSRRVGNDRSESGWSSAGRTGRRGGGGGDWNEWGM